MNRVLSLHLRVGLGFVGGALGLFALAADRDAVSPNVSPAPVAAAAQTNRSPVEAFRKLLAMTPAERDQYLALYPTELRPRVMAKVEEYQILPEPYRELRLKVTELRWYLLPLLKAPPAERADRLKEIPEPLQKLVATRLEEWSLWPQQLRDEVLEYESTREHLVGHGAGAQAQNTPDETGAALPPDLEQKLAVWRALPGEQREQIYARFEHYFDLSEPEKQKILQSLSEPERQETRKALNPIEKWPKPQQEQYVAAFRQFAEMSGGERQQFLKNAQRWQKMSGAERQAWRDLVKQLADSPPLPIGFVPPAK